MAVTVIEDGILILPESVSAKGFVGQVIWPVHRAAQNLRVSEMVFNTSMTGYQEIFTDPSYAGQTIVFTAAHVGNTGVNDQDVESPQVFCDGVITQNSLGLESSHRRQNDWITHVVGDDQRPGVPLFVGVDTRALTLVLREHGVVPGVIARSRDADSAKKLLSEALAGGLHAAYSARDFIAEVSTKKSYRVRPLVRVQNQGPLKKIIAFDFGVKRQLVQDLADLGAEVTVVPHDTSATEIFAAKPDGVFLSNGPGDPERAVKPIATVRELLGKLPIFGVCMGHQVLALALGAKTKKMKFGHRGGNHPVQDLTTGQVAISAHNHGFAVIESSLPEGVRVTQRSLNDHEVEGIEVTDQQAFSVQYHPESSPGPHDSKVLFERFFRLMR